MYQKLKSEIKEIIEIVNQCPESLQEKCFELLFENCINSVSQEETTKPKSVNLLKQEEVLINKSSENQISNVNDDIAEKDFHIKIKKFLTSNNIDIDVINKLYYKEDGKILPLYDSLKSTKMNECQIRLALLTAFENSHNDGNGELTFNGEFVRQRCVEMKCYDSANFAANFKKGTNLFDNWEDKYEKSTDYSLSPEGKKELAKILLELAKDE